MTLRKTAAITGFAELPSTKKPSHANALEMTAELAIKAVADAGLEKSDIDGLVTIAPSSTPSLLWPTEVCEVLGLNLSFFDGVELGGASSAGMILRAAAAINAGLCSHVLCVASDIMSSDSFKNIFNTIPQSDLDFELPYGNMPPIAGYAMITHRHMHEYGTTPKQLAKVAVDQRTNALNNPDALFGNKTLTLDDVLASPMICDPLHLTEIVSPCSGGGAVVVSRADAVANCPNKPVYLLGAGEAGSHTSATYAPSITDSWVKPSAKRAFEMAGVTHQQIDFVQPYDCFPITLLLTLEDMGFCAKGEGGRFIEEHDLTWRGDFPCNTHGGQLSFGQAGMSGGMCHVTEAVRQLMGRADGRQVANPSIGLAHGNGGIMGEQVTLILGLE